jgi:hypothetical protein
MVDLPNPVPLPPGTYVIGAFYPETPADGMDFGSNPTNGLIQYAPSSIQYVQERDSAPIPSGDSAIQLPTHSVFSGGVFGPNFEFETPEPSSFVLLIIGLSSGLALAAKKRLGKL